MGNHSGHLPLFLAVVAMSGCLLEDDAAPAEQTRADAQDFGALPNALSFVRGQSTVEEYLLDLPTGFRESFVLMARSGSNHAATLSGPRAILFGTDARSIVAFSDNPGDPLYDVVEVAQLQEDGYWQFAQIDFRAGAARVDTDGAPCARCHGTPLRPIWGTYPRWPGAFGEHQAGLTADQVEVLRAARVPGSRSRLRLLALPENPAVGQTFSLPARGRYPYANTSLNFELTAAVAEGIVRRLRDQPGWGRTRKDLLRAIWCGELDLRSTLRAAGLRENDFQLHRTSGSLIAGDFHWNQGGLSLTDMVAALIVDELYRFSDPRWNRFFEVWFERRGEARRSLLRGAWYDGFRPQEFIRGYLPSICDAAR